MGDQSPIRGLASLPGLAVLLTLVASVLYVKENLVSQRPHRDFSTVPPPVDAIPARLWEDPLEALELSKRKERIAAPSLLSMIFGDVLPIAANGKRTLQDEISHPLNSDAEGSSSTRRVRVLAAMLRSGTDEESHEHRIRTRQALQAALRISGYNAAHEEQLGVVEVSLGDKKERGVKFEAPFEWFVSDGLKPSGKAQGGAGQSDVTRSAEAVFVVWLSSNDFVEAPLKKLRELERLVASATLSKRSWLHVIVADTVHFVSTLFESSGPSCNFSTRPATLDVIGPADSTMFRSMLEEATSPLAKKSRTPTCIPLYSPFCTAEPALLCRGLTEGTRWKDVASVLAKHGFTYHPTIGPDDVLAHELIEELARRGANVAGRTEADGNVAIISEWDTFYGRAFPITFAAALAQHRSNFRSFADEFDRIINGEMPKNLKIFSYMRGIDGRTTKSAKEASALEATKRTSQGTDLGAVLGQSGVPEIPLGENQFDYIRRLVQRLRDSYPPTGSSKLRAIGVIGTDVYDKLLILQALREHFDDVLFFTTDIDARLFHRDQFSTTRNLLVASSYGLRLNDSLQRGPYQGDLSQFRDVYQTSFFVACRMALGTLKESTESIEKELPPMELQKALLAPRIFEIGRDQAVDLSISPADEETAMAAARIHPARTATAWALAWPLFLVVVTFGAACVLLGVTTDIFGPWFRPGGRIPWKRLLACVAVVVLYAVFVIWDHFGDGGEPFSLTTGTSIWPAVFLRIVALAIAIELLLKYGDKLRRNNEAVRAMILPDREREPVRLDRWKEFKDGIKLLWRWGSLDPRRWHNADLGLSVGDGERHCHDVIDVFREYRLRGRWSNRSARIIASVAVFFLFSTVVMLLSGNPNIPYRGSSSFWWDRVTLWLSGFACLTLLMAAVDATRLCHWFIKTIERPSRRGNAPLLWPRHSFAGIQEVLDAESQAMHRTSAQTTCARDFPELNELLLIKTISMRTKVVEEGVVFSSIALLAMLIARNNLFDAWNWPIGLILMYGVSFGYAIWSLFDMRNFAVRVRGRSLARLEACHLARLINSSQNEDTERIAKVIALVRENQTGAFSPPLESPILKSLLIPTGGISAMALLQFLIGLK